MKIPVRIYKDPKTGGGEYNVPLEVDILSWLAKPGDTVRKGDVLCEMESDKGVITLDAPADGVLTDIGFPVGSTWHRGAEALTENEIVFYNPPVCAIETVESVPVAPISDPAKGGETASPAPINTQRPELLTRQEARAAKPKVSLGAFALMKAKHISQEEVLGFYPNARNITEELVAASLAQRAAASLPKVVEVTMPTIQETKERDAVRASPLARKIARDKGVDLAAIKGTGSGGMIMVADVEAISLPASPPVVREAAALPPEAAIATTPAHADEETVFLRMPRLWRTIAENMEEASRIPTADAIVSPRLFDFTRAIAFYQTYREEFPYALWFPLMGALARVLAREEFFLFNSFWKEEILPNGTKQVSIGARRRVHMGIAYDAGEKPRVDWQARTISGNRLRILVVRDAHTKSVRELVQEVERLFSAAEHDKLELSDMAGYTCIFNNIGALGHSSGRSLLGRQIASEINLGLVADGRGILQIVFDHRMIDGAMITLFVRAIQQEMQDNVMPELAEAIRKKHI